MDRAVIRITVSLSVNLKKKAADKYCRLLQLPPPGGGGLRVAVYERKGNTQRKGTPKDTRVCLSVLRAASSWNQAMLQEAI